MKHIGIVACSAEGAALCYREICLQSGLLLGPYQHPRVTLDSIAMADWMPAFEAGDHERVAGFMLRSARALAKVGAELLICPDNSAHLAWAWLQDRSLPPWLHIAQVVAEEAQRRGLHTVGVLGTRFTMDGPVYRSAFAQVGIRTVVPAPDDARAVDSIIFDELVHGVISPTSRTRYQAVIHRLADAGCDAVALACTEIPLLISPGDSPLPVLDSTRLLAGAAVETAMA